MIFVGFEVGQPKDTLPQAIENAAQKAYLYSYKEGVMAINLLYIGCFFAGLGFFFVGIGVLLWGNGHNKRN